MGFAAFSPVTYAAEANAAKKAILVVSFGTTFPDTRKATIDSVTEKIRTTFPDYEVRQAFTSRIIIKRVQENEGIKYDTEKQALAKLQADGYKEVIVQPLHMEAGDEYDKVRKVVESYQGTKAFDKIALGRPILYYVGQEEKPDDYMIAIKALQKQFPKIDRNEAVVFMGHGGVHPSNAAYAALQMKIKDAGLNNAFVFTVEGYPSFENLLETLKANKIKKVTLMPLMVVAGDHANNDMAGDESDSFKSQLLAAGYKVDTYLHGLGENAAIQDIYVQHVKDAISGELTQRSADAPSIPVIE
ncbi:sirohydrochlorin cobaltochelatase [Propionispora sp. 2/2-37]|uniref:sirohydrochlorin cobaltochelatase n=1 Tax=Propionispora sp. 2/2-37 TaxID=1677858 RepID=UPI0006BB63B6|nr:sirohydrochlorin cobaltochelatase [Propionispora sp. 2/2-37]